MSSASSLGWLASTATATIGGPAADLPESSKPLSAPPPLPSTPRPRYSYERYLLAATILEDAVVGCETVHSSGPQLVARYRFYRNVWLRRILQLCVVVILALALFERPNGTLGILLPLSVTIPIELACLAFFAFRLYQLRQISLRHVFWRDAKNVGLAVLLLVREK